MLEVKNGMVKANPDCKAHYTVSCVDYGMKGAYCQSCLDFVHSKQAKISQYMR